MTSHPAARLMPLIRGWIARRLSGAPFSARMRHSIPPVIPMRFAVALALALSAWPSFASPSDPAQVLVDSFVRTLTSGNPKAFLAIAESNSSTQWFWEDLDHKECVVVRGYRFTAESASRLRLEIDASASSKGAAHKQIPLPSAWILDVTCDAQQCRLQGLETEEHRAARLYAEVPPADAAALEVCPGLDPLVFAHDLAGYVEQVPPLIHAPEASRMLFVHALEAARQADDRALESWIWSRAAWVVAMRGEVGLANEMTRASVAAANDSGDPD